MGINLSMKLQQDSSISWHNYICDSLPLFHQVFLKGEFTSFRKDQGDRVSDGEVGRSSNNPQIKVQGVLWADKEPEKCLTAVQHWSTLTLTILMRRTFNALILTLFCSCIWSWWGGKPEPWSFSWSCPHPDPDGSDIQRGSHPRLCPPDPHHRPVLSQLDRHREAWYQLQYQGRLFWPFLFQCRSLMWRACRGRQQCCRVMSGPPPAG